MWNLLLCCEKKKGRIPRGLITEKDSKGMLRVLLDSLESELRF
nr:infA [Citrus glauca]